MADTGTVTISEKKLSAMEIINFAWTSTTGGLAEKTTTESYDGLIYRVITDPGSSNSAPSGSYDVVLNDSDGYDVLNGLLDNLSSGTTVQYGISTGGSVKTPISAVSSKLTLAVSSAGSGKSGEVIVYIR